VHLNRPALESWLQIYSFVCALENQKPNVLVLPEFVYQRVCISVPCLRIVSCTCDRPTGRYC